MRPTVLLCSCGLRVEDHTTCTNSALRRTQSLHWAFLQRMLVVREQAIGPSRCVGVATRCGGCTLVAFDRVP